MDHPIHLLVTDDLRRNRLTVFFRLLLALPHFVWLFLWGIAALFAHIVAWFAALFTKRVPNGIHGFLAGYVRYQVHVYAYATLAANPFPEFNGAPGYPVDVEIAGPEDQNRWTVFFRFILVIPALIISGVLNYLMNIVAFFAWFVCLFMGTMPEGMRNVLAYTIRYHAQTQGYYSLVTPRYPSINVGL